MFNKNNFYVINYEESYCRNLITWWKNQKESKFFKSNFNDKDTEEFDVLVNQINKFDFKNMEKLSVQIQLLTKNRKKIGLKLVI